MLVGRSFGIGLLLQVSLHAAQLSLAVGTHLVVVLLARIITCQTSDSAAECALDAAANTARKITKLALGLLLLALQVLLASGVLEALFIVTLLVYMFKAFVLVG